VQDLPWKHERAVLEPLTQLRVGYDKAPALEEKIRIAALDLLEVLPGAQLRVVLPDHAQRAQLPIQLVLGLGQVVRAIRPDRPR
jgi:hypothetical protein